jgi:hypothetical protein
MFLAFWLNSWFVWQIECWCFGSLFSCELLLKLDLPMNTAGPGAPLRDCVIVSSYVMHAQCMHDAVTLVQAMCRGGRARSSLARRARMVLIYRRASAWLG